jgi:hypothetical protein
LEFFFENFNISENNIFSFKLAKVLRESSGQHDVAWSIISKWTSQLQVKLYFQRSTPINHQHPILTKLVNSLTYLKCQAIHMEFLKISIIM